MADCHICERPETVAEFCCQPRMSQWAWIAGRFFYHLSHQGSPSLADMLTNSDIQGSDMVDMSVLRQRAERVPILPPKYMVLTPEGIIFTRNIIFLVI